MTRNGDITLYQNAQKRGQAQNAAGFTRRYDISAGDTDKLAEAVAYDNCPGQYKDGYRTSAGFQRADCVLGDIDNSQSDDPAEWKDHSDVKAALPGVSFYWYPSRNNMKSKSGEEPRPREHYIFPIDEMTSAEEYAGYMKWLIDSFPHLHFDPKVKSPAQLNFGVESPQVSYVAGELY